MQILSLIWGILAFVCMLIAFIPFLGWMNWLVIPFSAVGLIISIVSIFITKRLKGLAIAGTVMCGLAVVLAVLRLIMGKGVI